MSVEAINQTDNILYTPYSFGANHSDVTAVSLVSLVKMDESSTFGVFDDKMSLNSTQNNNTIVGWTTTNQSAMPFQGHMTSKAAIVSLSVLFSIIVFVGICGNVIVMYSILSDVKMRRSVTNCFILNLAVADLLIMLLGIPEMVQFILHRGWLMGNVLCKVNRYILVTSLYASISTLMGVCIERYVAIVHPIQAHIWCSKRRTLIAIAISWPIGMLFGLPTMLFNTLAKPFPGAPVEICRLSFPGPYSLYLMATYKLAEFFMFFLGPVLMQIVMYSIIAKNLFIGTEKLHRKKMTRVDGTQKMNETDTVKVRKGVVKMLIATVAVYFISYTPVQVPLFYNLVSKTGPFKQSWIFLALVMTLCHINSAANPILYSIFSQKFRKKFLGIFTKCTGKDKPNGHMSRGQHTSFILDSYQSRGSYKVYSYTGRYTHFNRTISTST